MATSSQSTVLRSTLIKVLVKFLMFWQSISNVANVAVEALLKFVLYSKMADLLIEKNFQTL